MCTNQREITNKYTGRKLYVKCGHCPACLQEKAAHRVSRIKAQDSPDLDCVMVTLTYRRHDAPFVYRDEAYWFSHGNLGYCDRFTRKFYPYNLNVYREHNYRKVRSSSDYKVSYKDIGRKVLCDIEPNLTDSGLCITYDFGNNKDLAHCYNKIGVCYYPDVQDFVERLRINLNRHYEFKESFKVFCCSEYGTRSLRPHMHLLLWIPKGTFETFRNAITESWPYGDLSKFDRSVERAFRASSYVASYVNCDGKFPVFLKTYFKPKHSYSKDFGCNNRLFQLDKILEKFSRGHLTYFKQVDKQAIPTIVECPFPKYIISRYFPKFKGYSRITSAAQCQLMERFAKFDYSEKFDLNLFSPQLYGINRLASPVVYSNDEVYRFSIRLINAYKRFISLAPESWKLSFSDYCQLHSRVWVCYNADIQRLHLSNPDIPLNEKYDNLEEVKQKCFPKQKFYDFSFENGDIKFSDTPVDTPLLPIGFSRDMLVVTNPNEFVSTKVITDRFFVSYYEHLKHRAVSNALMSSLHEEF